jgi:hypothetical protein
MTEADSEFAAWVKGACPSALYERACLMFQQKGNPVQVASLLEKILETIPDKRDPVRLRAIFMMGKLLLFRRRADALAYLKEFFALGSLAFGSENDEVLYALQLYAEACMKTETRSGGGLGNAERALDLLLKTLEVKHGPESPALLQPLELYLRLLRDIYFRRPSHAPKARPKELQVIERGLLITERAHGKRHIEYGRWLMNLSDYYLGPDETTSHLAVPLLKEALPIVSQQGESFEVSHCAHSLSQALEQCGKLEEAHRMMSIYALS